MGSFRSVHKCTFPDEGKISFALHRLQMLENAVLNYSGGLSSLLSRVENQAARHQQDCPEAAAMFTEIARYLHDVAEAGHLDLRDTATFMREMRK